MRFVLCILIGIICMSGFSQTRTNVLTNKEAITLNSIFNNKNEFDFKEKKVAYAVGITGTQIEGKLIFFKKYINPVVEGESKNVCSLIILTNEEKSESGGFDVVIMTPVKLFNRKHRKFLISELKETIEYK